MEAHIKTRIKATLQCVENKKRFFCESAMNKSFDFNSEKTEPPLCSLSFYINFWIVYKYIEAYKWYSGQVVCRYRKNKEPTTITTTCLLFIFKFANRTQNAV